MKILMLVLIVLQTLHNAVTLNTHTPTNYEDTRDLGVVTEDISVTEEGVVTEATRVTEDTRVTSEDVVTETTRVTEGLDTEDTSVTEGVITEDTSVTEQGVITETTRVTDEDVDTEAIRVTEDTSVTEGLDTEDTSVTEDTIVTEGVITENTSVTEGLDTETTSVTEPEGVYNNETLQEGEYIDENIVTMSFDSNVSDNVVTDVFDVNDVTNVNNTPVLDITGVFSGDNDVTDVNNTPVLDITGVFSDDNDVTHVPYLFHTSESSGVGVEVTTGVGEREEMEDTTKYSSINLTPTPTLSLETEEEIDLLQPPPLQLLTQDDLWGVVGQVQEVKMESLRDHNNNPQQQQQQQQNEENDDDNNNDDDNVNIFGTLIETVVMVGPSLLQTLNTAEQTIHRLPRTVTPLVESLLSTYTVPEHTIHRLPRTVTPLVESILSTSLNNVKEEGGAEERRSDDPNIDDIIQGIVELLGGQVKVTAVATPATRLTTFIPTPPTSTRINNRGPPRLPHFPFGALASALNTRAPHPIRPPVTPPSRPNPPGRPPFLANTLPPFLAPLPPSLASRPLPPLHRRPGMVLDDPEYQPGHVITGAVIPIAADGGNIFDVTVSAHQGFGNSGGSGGSLRPLSPLRPGGVVGVGVGVGPIVTSPAGVGVGVGERDNFVSIDGRKTYFDLFPSTTQQQPSIVGTGVGIVIPEDPPLPAPPAPPPPPPPAAPPKSPPPPTQAGGGGGVGVGGGGYYVPQPRPRPRPRPRPPQTTPRSYTRRTTQPSIRIDTCIVGDDSTCQDQLGEVCRTEEGVSSCYCKPGTARRRPRTPCKRMVSLRVSLKVDRVGDQRIVWGGNYGNPESQEYQRLQWEAQHAITNAMTKTRLGSAYLGNTVHKFYSLGGKVIVNSTVMLEERPDTRTASVRRELQRQMIQVIRSHANNIGDSALWVDGPLNPIPDVSDVNECYNPTLHDCNIKATCINQFGTFTCRCLPGYTDRRSSDPEESGRECESCSTDYCNKRGDCSITSGQKVCQCRGSYYGNRCEVDGEVLGVAVGASVAAVLIIILTLIFLCMWSRRWKAQDRKTEVLARGVSAVGGGAGLGGYTINMQQKGGALGGAGAGAGRYGVVGTLEDRIRWAQIADTLTNRSVYAQQVESGLGGVSGMGVGMGVYAASSSDYLTAAHHPRPLSALNRVSRALGGAGRGGVGRGGGGLGDQLRKALKKARRRSRKSRRRGRNREPQEPTLNLQQLMALHAQLTAAGASSSGYASLGTLNTTTAPPSGMYSIPTTLQQQQHQQQQQFGLQHLNPMSHLSSLQEQHQQQQQQQHHQQLQQQQQHLHHQQQQLYGGGGGVSRATTLGARTPVPLLDLSGGGGGGIGGGTSTVGPMGGGSVAPSGPIGGGIGVGSEDQSYHLPRPKSRVSLGVGTSSLAQQQQQQQHSRIARSYNSLLF
ncbi:hypothetical protein Pmani_007867 [Petrolisthes manimaculis]|uniref:63 kDa sperm flagellar membrane protein n=1 Tax=Petrolisthes manimaculis TaxID=1843537 RepID=A0AAE1Q7Y1_9EUCA|nr:hypothetical protein Pmani_007867 [Petrolisthes manimaculis]